MNKRKILSKDMIADAFKSRTEHPSLSTKEFGVYMNQKWKTTFSESAWRKAIQSGEKAVDAYAPDDIFLEKLLKQKLLIEEKKLVTKLANKKLEELSKVTATKELAEQLNVPLQVNTGFEKVQEDNTADGTPIYIISDMQEDGSNFSKNVFEIVGYEIRKDIRKNNYKTVIILENGDGIDGILRVSDLYHNQGGYVDQLVNYQQNLANLLLSISKICYVQFSIINSNHTELRPMGTSRGQVKQEDVTLLIYTFLRKNLEKQNIYFLNQEVDNALQLNYNIFSVEGFKIFQHHGDMRYSSANNPVGTFNKIKDQYGADIDIAILAHYHHTTFLKHISKTLGRRGDKQILFVPALDPRQTKQNEIEMGVASEPSFTKIVINKNEGIRSIEFFRTGEYI